MLRTRHANPQDASFSSTGFQLGQTIGRALIGLATAPLTAAGLKHRLVMGVFLLIAVAMQFLFWFIPSFLASAIAVSFLGFFLGPLFPAGVVTIVNLLPRRLHVSAIGFATALGGTGGAVFPFAIGAVVQVKDVGSLQPIILALLLGVLGLWMGFPWRSQGNHDVREEESVQLRRR
jgi:MFS family permease